MASDNADDHVAKDIIVIGSGPAGCTAAVYAARAGKDVLMIAGLEKGGQLMLTTEVENYPGFVTIQGPDLMAQMVKQVEHCGAEVIYDDVKEITTDQRPFSLSTEIKEHKYRAKALIFATGAQAKWLGLDSEQKFMGRGLSACATCDGLSLRD